MNKFTINEDDQFDILKVVRLDNRLGVGAGQQCGGNSKLTDLLDQNECFKDISDRNESVKEVQNKLRQRRKVIKYKLKSLRACSGIVDIFFFGFFEYKKGMTRRYKRADGRYPLLAIKNIIQKSVDNLKKSQFKLSRISIIDFRYGEIWDQTDSRNGNSGMGVFLRIVAVAEQSFQNKNFNVGFLGYGTRRGSENLSFQ